VPLALIYIIVYLKHYFWTLIFSTNSKNLRLTFKIDDGLPALQTAGLQGWQTVVEQNIAEGEARTMFCGTRAAERRRSVNRVLDEVLPFLFTRIIFY